MKIDLSIITVSFNTKDITLNCLTSVIKNTQGVNYEIIVVENGSKDGSSEALRKFAQDHLQVTFVDAGKNTGFSKGNNLGVSKAKGEFLLFLNSDTVVKDNALKEVFDFIKDKKDLGVYSCRLLNVDGSIQPSGGHFPNLLNVFAWQFFIDDLPFIGPLIPSFHPHKSFYDQDKRVDWVTGAFLLIPRVVFEAVGGFDENIFMYTEEMELTYRIAKTNKQAYIKKTPSIVHLGGASGGSFIALTSEVKNMLYFWKKHKPSWQMPLIKFIFFSGSLLRLLLFGIIKGDEKSRRTYTEALKFLL
jgi:hypothetical protein